MSFVLARGEELVTCPYDICHLVRKERLSMHLDKCRRNYYKKCEETGINVIYYPCKHNPAHQFTFVEISYHEQLCPDQYDVIPTPPIVPRRKLNTPTEDELRKFKRLIREAGISTEDDWELESLLNRAPEFVYNNNSIDETYRRAQEFTDNAGVAYNRSTQPIPKPEPKPEPKPPQYPEPEPLDKELEYLLVDTDDEDEPMPLN